ncbi:hypothetical protein O4H29_19910 [Marinobacter salarius]|uniref:hypothetical protein n=1 Tax=Marinobacter salarius TaxID=1420917 RepID=UPI0022B1924B|nr:hypothetical protein [Marinobacter salarius]MCZ4287103.1 hypothetical protein [Marinobacter salarius]
MGITEKSRFEQLRRNWNSRLRAWQTDRQNKALYGEDAPRFAEQLWVPIYELEFAVKAGSSKQSGQIIRSWPTGGLGRVDQTVAIKACVAHWRGGLSWEETGIYDAMMDQIRKHGKVDRLRTLEDVKLRYRQLDALYESVRQAGRLSPRDELIPGNFREEGGILVNIGPDGKPYFGRKGNHRLAMAIAAGIDRIPAQLGVVHIEGLPALPDYRNAPPNETAN